jgi:hypothetical protein
MIRRTESGKCSVAVGCERPIQFNREYRRFFGQPPVRDIMALRDSKVAATTAANALSCSAVQSLACSRLSPPALIQHDLRLSKPAFSGNVFDVFRLGNLPQGGDSIAAWPMMKKEIQDESKS